MTELDRIHSKLESMDEKMDAKFEAVIVQTTKTNGRVSTHAMILYPLGAVVLLLCGALLANGTIDIGLFK